MLYFTAAVPSRGGMTSGVAWPRQICHHSYWPSCFASLRHHETYDTHVDTTAPHTGWTSDTAEGATALSLPRLSFIRSFVLRLLSR